MRIGMLAAGLMVFAVMNGVSGYAQEGAALAPISTENVGDLELIDALGDGALTQIAWSPAGDQIAVASTRGIWLHDVAGDISAPQRVALGEDESVEQIAFSPDGTQIAAVMTDGVVYLLDVFTGEYRTLTRLDGDARRFAIAFSPDGSLLAIGDSGRIRVVNLTTRLGLLTLEGVCDFEVSALAFSPNGDLLACVSATYGDMAVAAMGVYRFSDSATLVASQPALWRGPLSIHFLPEGYWLTQGIAWTDDASESLLALWDLQTADPIPLPSWMTALSAPVISPVGDQIAAHYGAGRIDILDLESGQMRHSRDFGGAILGKAFSPDGTQLAVAVGYEVLIWSLAEDTTRALPGHYFPAAWQVAVSPDGTRYAAVYRLQRSSIYDESYAGPPIVAAWYASRIGGTEPRVLTMPDDPPGPIAALTISADGRLVAMGTADGLITLWGFDNGVLYARLDEYHEGQLYALEFAADNSLVALICGDFQPDGLGYGAAQQTAAQVRYQEVLCGEIYGAHFDREAGQFTRIVQREGSPGPQVAVVQLPDGEVIDTHVAQGTLPVDLAFNPAGDTFAIGAGDEAHGGGGVYIDLTVQPIGGEPVALIRDDDPHGMSIVHAVAFSADGSVLAAGGGDSRRLGEGVTLWDWADQPTGPRAYLREDRRAVLDLAFSRDGTVLVVAGADGVIRVWGGPPPQGGP